MTMQALETDSPKWKKKDCCCSYLLKEIINTILRLSLEGYEAI